MDANNTEQGPAQHTAERFLPRGLEHISRAFLSSPTLGRIPIVNSQNASPVQSNPKPGDPSPPVVLQPCRFPARQEVVSLLKEQPAALEEGMKAIDANIPCEASGNIEVLALDSRNQLAIIDLEDHFSDELLLRGVAHADWIGRNTPNVRRMYRSQVINFSLQPRIFLVAPEFSTLFRSVTRHFTTLQIHCLKYHAVALPSGVGILFEQAFQSPFRETAPANIAP